MIHVFRVLQTIRDGEKHCSQRCGRDLLRSLEGLRATAKDMNDKELGREVLDAIKELKCESAQPEPDDPEETLPDGIGSATSTSF